MVLRYDGTSTTLLYFCKKYDGTVVQWYKYDGTSLLQKYDGTVVRWYKYDGTLLLQKVRRYCSTTVQVRRYFTFAKRTTVLKYDGTVVLQKRRKVRQYCGVAKMAKSTTVL